MADQTLPVITISRQYGAGGRSVAKKLSERLGIPYYDVDFVRLTSKISGYSEEEVRREGEDLGGMAKFINHFLTTASFSNPYDEIFQAQKAVILGLAEKPCIIVGRCSNFILREAKIPSFDVFLSGSREFRLKRAAELHRADPLKPGYAQAALGAGWSQALSPKLVQKVFEDLLRQGKLIQAGDVLCLPGHEVILDESQQKLREAMLGAFRKGGLTPPNLSDVIAAAGSTEKAAAALLRVLVRDKEIYRVSDSLYYSKEAVEEIRGKVTEWFKTHDDLSVAGMKELLGLSRKFIIPLLEFLDQEKITVRIGDKRQLRSR